MINEARFASSSEEGRAATALFQIAISRACFIRPLTADDLLDYRVACSIFILHMRDSRWEVAVKNT